MLDVADPMKVDPPTPTEVKLARSPTENHPPPRTSLRRSFRDLRNFATVMIGGKEDGRAASFAVHKDLLVSASPFFAAALNGNFAEGLDQVVTLPEEKPECFEWFIWWLYTGSLSTPISDTSCSSRPAPKKAEPKNTCSAPSNNHDHLLIFRTRTDIYSPGSAQTIAQRQQAASLGSARQAVSNTPTHHDGDLRNEAGSPKYFLLLELYALSDRLLTTELSNHIIDTIARLSETTNSVPTPSDTWVLYDAIRDTAPIRALVLDLFAYKKTDRLLETHRDDWHPRFMRDLLVKLKRPGPETLERHALVAWRIASWQQTKPCEACRELIKPVTSGGGVGGPFAEKCAVCERAFCVACLRTGRMGQLSGDVGPCKPWLRGMCGRYHEHALVAEQDVLDSWE